MRDYSEKRLSREGLDRSKPAPKNRPRKESGGLYLLLTLFAIVVSFGAGVGTGWFLFKGARKAAPATVAQPTKKEEPAASAAAQPKPEVPLTFYKTLPAGGKAVIGTGLNLKKPEPSVQAPHEPASPPAPAAAPESDGVPNLPPAAPVVPPGSPSAAPAAAGKAETALRFVVQVASYRDKQEAVAAQSKLTGKGVAAYLVESRLPDKNVWFRLRIGRHLTKAEASELAAKAGKGALILPE